MHHSISYRALRRLAFLPLLAGLLLLTACDSNDPDEDEGAGEEEVITLVRLTLTPQGGGAAFNVDANFDERGVLQSAGTVALAPGTTYDVAIDLQNTLESPPESITAEIRDEEPDAHRFFYTPEGAVSDNIAVSILDSDPSGDPLGLSFRLAVTGGAGESGSLRVKLRHYEEDANLPTDKRNDTATAPAVPGVVENDIDFTFPVSIN
jgi:hypothetical protein